MTPKIDPPPVIIDDHDLTDANATANGSLPSLGGDRTAKEDDHREASSLRSSLSGEGRATSPPSSPPTSVETPLKESSSTERAASSPLQRGGQREGSVESEDSANAHRRQSEVDISALSDLESDEDRDDEDREGSVHRSTYRRATVESEEDEDNAAPHSTFRRPSHVPKNWETTSSQWEDEEAADPLPHSSTRRSTVSQKSPPYVSPIYTARSRPNVGANSPKQHLQPLRHRSPMSRASSASYEGDKKAPLVLLHVTLLCIPGADEELYSFLTPTILERGVLVEHPRGDHHLLEELILDALGIDEEYEEEDDDDTHQSWEKSLGVPKPAHKKKWEVRVYASNGLMTAGAWRRVWGEMERIDVEIWPRNRRLANTIASRPKSAGSIFSATGKDGKINGSIRSRRGSTLTPGLLSSPSLRPPSPLSASSLQSRVSALSTKESTPFKAFSFFTTGEASRGFQQLPVWLKVVGVANVAFFTYFTFFQLLGLSLSFNHLGSRSVALQEVKVSFGSEMANAAAAVNEDVASVVEGDVEVADVKPEEASSEDSASDISEEAKIDETGGSKALDSAEGSTEGDAVVDTVAQSSETARESKTVQIPLLPQDFESTEDFYYAESKEFSADEDGESPHSLVNKAEPTNQKSGGWSWGRLSF